MRCVRHILVLITFLGIGVPLCSQPDYVLSGTICHTMPNSEEWDYISDYGPGIDLAMQMPQLWVRQFGDTSYQLIRVPYNMGLRFNFTMFPNEIAGHRFSLSPYIQQPLYERERNTLFFEFDGGLAYYTKPYRRSHDTTNVFIGSFINCMIQIGLVYRYAWRDNSALYVSAMFAHSSNGYLKKPNKGLNYMQLQVGYQFPRRNKPSRLFDKAYRIWDEDSTAYVYLPMSFDDNAFPRHDIMVSVAPALVRPRYQSIRDQLYYAYTARVGWQYHFDVKRAVGANVDITYNGTHDKLRDMLPVDYDLPFYVALCGNYEATWHKLSLHVGMAYYVLRSWHQHNKYYERVGVFYNFGDDVSKRTRHFVGVSLKSHAAHVDFIEWHYGIKFRVGGRK